jgi:hypothetical protein
MRGTMAQHISALRIAHRVRAGAWHIAPPRHRAHRRALAPSPDRESIASHRARRARTDSGVVEEGTAGGRHASACSAAYRTRRSHIFSLLPQSAHLSRGHSRMIICCLAYLLHAPLRACQRSPPRDISRAASVVNGGRQ